MVLLDEPARLSDTVGLAGSPIKLRGSTGELDVDMERCRSLALPMMTLLRVRASACRICASRLSKLVGVPGAEYMGEGVGLTRIVCVGATTRELASASILML